ncbi:hypothetical protein FisN_13Lh332 [Fistulifera solaris]|uniref:Uncharacterized protein n=1 Tax=Fistulifera solaris TaxID=1519565 RepID=A0A1Z5KLC3_FISSO|nr:hypothetical protein FisN_13Lh332 [Fistulifera solaris]|eukprot:GAX27120.1 hypothetical protein FisN_13Lh332 [Fistulifera solaris]
MTSRRAQGGVGTASINFNNQHAQQSKALNDLSQLPGTLAAKMRLLFLFIAFVGADAFVVADNIRPVTIALQAQSGSGVARMFGLVAAVSVFSLSSPPSLALDFQGPIAPFASSTVHIAEAIKVLDMGLPTYGDIKDSKASVTNVKSLSTEATGMMSRSKKSSGGSDAAETPEKKSVAQKQSYTPAKPTYVPAKQEKATPMPSYDF